MRITALSVQGSRARGAREKRASYALEGNLLCPNSGRSRFAEPTDALVHRYNASIGFDARLYDEDITGSVAWAEGLAAAGLLTADERDALLAGLEAVRAEFAAGAFAIVPDDEDIHSAVERRLTELVGPVGGKLHTGRSRNDQVAT
jgi:argininosuccinate lyase